MRCCRASETAATRNRYDCRLNAQQRLLVGVVLRFGRASHRTQSGQLTSSGIRPHAAVATYARIARGLYGTPSQNRAGKSQSASFLGSKMTRPNTRRNAEPNCAAGSRSGRYSAALTRTHAFPNQVETLDAEHGCACTVLEWQPITRNHLHTIRALDSPTVSERSAFEFCHRQALQPRVTGSTLRRRRSSAAKWSHRSRGQPKPKPLHPTPRRLPPADSRHAGPTH